MNLFIQLAWRNIWRNPRRTLLILTAIVIGVWSMVFLGALMRGMEVMMVQNNLKILTGNLQIHHPAYRQDPSIENSMADSPQLNIVLDQHLPQGGRWCKRIRLDAVAANARHTTGVTLVGIDPKQEAAISFIKEAMAQGRYLTAQDTHAVVVGRALLKQFQTKIGHKLVLMLPGADRESVSKAFRIVGMFQADMEATEKRFVFVNRLAAANMLGMENRISEVGILLPHQRLDGNRENQVLRGLQSGLPKEQYRVEAWQELLPMIKGYLGIFDGFIYIWYLVVFIAMGFGIVNTSLMAIYERMREFGLLRAFGVQSLWIILGVVVESFFLLMVGILIGNSLGVGCTWLVDQTGINLSALSAGAEMWGLPRVLFPELWGVDVLIANGVVLLLGLLVSLYPAVAATRFTVVETMNRN